MKKTMEQREQEAHLNFIRKFRWVLSPFIVFGVVIIIFEALRLDRIFDYLGYLSGRKSGRLTLLHSNMRRARNKGHYEEAERMAEELLPQIEPLQSEHSLYRGMKHDAYLSISLAHLHRNEEEKAGECLVRAAEALQSNSIERLKLTRLDPYLRAGVKRPVFAYLKIIETLWADGDFAKRYGLGDERHQVVRDWKQTINQGGIPDDRYWKS